MIEIRPIQPEEIPAAKMIIVSVAYRIYGWPGTLEESLRHFEAIGQFKDMDEVQAHYFDNGGPFLAALEDGNLIGSGALRKVDESTAELKRMWLLENYHGRGIGYQLITRLFDFARARGYRRIILGTGVVQTRAIAFYQRLGFTPYPNPEDDDDDLSMELELT